MENEICIYVYYSTTGTIIGSVKELVQGGNINTNKTSRQESIYIVSFLFLGSLPRPHLASKYFLSHITVSLNIISNSEN